MFRCLFFVAVLHGLRDIGQESIPHFRPHPAAGYTDQQVRSLSTAQLSVDTGKYFPGQKLVQGLVVVDVLFIDVTHGFLQCQKKHSCTVCTHGISYRASAVRWARPSLNHHNIRFNIIASRFVNIVICPCQCVFHLRVCDIHIYTEKSV
jgi:hypothetical protein